MSGKPSSTLLYTNQMVCRLTLKLLIQFDLEYNQIYLKVICLVDIGLTPETS